MEASHEPKLTPTIVARTSDSMVGTSTHKRIRIENAIPKSTGRVRTAPISGVIREPTMWEGLLPAHNARLAHPLQYIETISPPIDLQPRLMLAVCFAELGLLWVRTTDQLHEERFIVDWRHVENVVLTLQT